jgi:spermidine/putrescine-binding protein
MKHSRITQVALVALLALTAVACGSSSKSSTSNTPTSTGSGTSGLKVPTADIAPASSIGKGEGSLNLIAWEGYTDPSWVKPFEQQTGCKVNA